VRSLRSTKAASKSRRRRSNRYLAAFEIAPEDEQTAVDVERAAKATQAWDRLIEAYKSGIEKADGSGDVMLGVGLRLKLGRVLAVEVNRIEDAIAAYRAVWEMDAENADALGALERLYRQTSRFTDLLEIYEKKRDLAADPAERKRIQYEIAVLFENEAKDTNKAIESYLAVLEDDATDAKALQALDVLYGRLEKWEPYVDVLRRRIELDVGEAELVDLKFRLGGTLEKHIGDAAGALENYREILFLDSGHEGAKSSLEALLQHADLKAEAAAILESIYEERSEWQKLIVALEILAGSEGELQKRVQLQRKIARISSDQLNDHARAFSALATAVKDDPTLPDTRREIEMIAEQSNALEKLVALYSSVAEQISDAQLAREFWFKVAHVDEQLGKVDDAAAGYEHVLSIDPADAEALGALENLFTRTERWTDLIGVSQRRIDQTNDPEQREQLYYRMAAIYDEKLGKPEEGAGCYRKVLELDATNDKALAALDSLLVRQEMWPELAENLESQLALSTDENHQLALMLRLAQLRETKMNQVEAAIEGYRQVLERDANNAQALGALEALGRDPKHEPRHRRSPRAALSPARRLRKAHRRPRSAGPPRGGRFTQGGAPPSSRLALRGRRG